MEKWEARLTKGKHEEGRTKERGGEANRRKKVKDEGNADEGGKEREAEDGEKTQRSKLKARNKEKRWRCGWWRVGSLSDGEGG